MIKKLLLFFSLCLFVLYSHAQDQSENQIFTGNATVDYRSTENNLHLQMQVGGPIISTAYAGAINTRVGFPYGILYISPTFVIDGFEVSKGYYADKVNIKWEFGANQNLIEKINIYRKELGSATPEQLIGSVSKDVFEFNDTQVQGGVLYQYKVEAVGVSQFNERFINYIDGVGFRNPTATVSGSVSFDGGSPVRDVIVFAEANGAENSTGAGSSLKFENGYVSIDKIAYDIPATKLTLQSWITSKGDIFKFTTSDGRVLRLYAGKTDDNTIVMRVVLNGVTQHEVTLSNAYPTGTLDNLGKDVFANIASLTETSFMHISALLESNKTPKFYINGRELTSAYISGATIPTGVTAPQLTSNTGTYGISGDIKFTKIVLGDGYVGYLDEVRIWQRLLSDQEIRRDYRRYLSGGEPDLSVYLRMDESSGTNVYDLSKKGFRQNKNDGVFVLNASNGVRFSTTKPSKEQLGVFGVTDATGSYTISSIPYSGNGESFVITPSLGVHKFEPASQTVFLGSDASVVNQLNFKDISSFQFNGRVVYNVQNVFNSIPLETEEANYTDIEDYGYNKYRVTSNGSKIIINKGQYYYEGGAINSANGFYEGGTLKKYPVIGIDKASVYIDGNIVIDENNQPVLTDNEGNFTINVPIGKHRIEVKKEGHTFVFSGAFPSNGTFDYFEDQIERRWFIDTTRISFIGKVVGGKIQSEKPLGFGLNGEYSYTNFEGQANEEKEIISSKNNIGVANLTLKGDINTNIFDVSFATHPATGEFEVQLIPYIYYIKTTDLKIPTNPDISILSSNETLNLSGTPKLDSISFKTKDGTDLYSKAFHHKRSFRYNAPVTLALVSQQYEKEIDIKGTTFDISELPIPIYLQKKKYDIIFEVTQQYINKDGNEPVVTKEYYKEGTFNITNNLEISDKSSTTLINGGKQYRYSFYAGEPNISISDNFASSITVEYSIPGSNPLPISNLSEFKSKGIIKGGSGAGGVSFATVAPEVPDIILRDPPGSNSSASIQKGTTISYKQETTNANSEANGGGYYVSVAPTIKVSVGFISWYTDLETKFVADTEGSFSKKIDDTAQNVTTNTYTFNQTISTSDDPSFVGSDGDLYIGNAKNVYYGIFNNMFVTDAPLTLANGTPVENIQVQGKDKDGNPVTLYISTRKDFFIAEQPTNTFFTYSQKYILETLIPQLEALAANFVPNPNPNPDPLTPVFTKETYLNQANLWRRIVQENERVKFEAKNNQGAYKQAVLDRVKGIGNLQSELNSLVLENFYANQSFDSGVGQFTSSVTSAAIIGNSVERSIVTSEDFKAQMGLLIQNAGATNNYTRSNSTVSTQGLTSENEITSTISYTLKDSDPFNVLSVDVVNMFDGNGPVFITKAGSTSCPHEPEKKSVFYKKVGYNPSVVGTGGEVLSEATNKVYLPEVKATKNVLTNVPESEGALFTLQLKNRSETQSDLEYIVSVDAVSLNGATTNVSSSGVKVYLPYNETVEFPFEVYKSSASSTYKYDNIRVYLKSPCDDLTSSEGFIDLSVEFKKSCSKVSISSPQANWVFNRSAAYSIDANGTKSINKLPISFTDFNTNFNGFRKIELQYRNAGSANWIKFKSYYGTQELLNESGDQNGVVIDPSTASFTYEWDVVGEKIADGNYEFRAISYCTDNITYTSAVVAGVINLNPPVAFGTPQPSDGILDVGEDISVRYSENVMKGGATDIKVTGFSNQQDIDHSVTVYLDGSGNQIELPNQILPDGSLSLQFWYKNNTIGSGTFISQDDGIKASLNGNIMTFEIGGKSVQGVIKADSYNFYSLVYQSGGNPQLLILENGTQLGATALAQNLDLNSSNSIKIGGSNVIGNIHDVRFWSKSFTPAQATVAKDKTLTGRELNLLGYWKLDEGNGRVGADRAKSRNATVSLDWDIKPKGTAYRFANSSYLTLDRIGFVQPTEVEDLTLSFWIKAASGATGTLLSNGKGDDSEPIQTNGYRNKWAVSLGSDGNLSLTAENINYALSTTPVTDGTWHHVALVVKRGGSINSYIDAVEASSVSAAAIGGLSASKMVVGARLFQDSSANVSIDNHFTGFLDEIRLWNTARSFEQLKRDRYFELEASVPGLALYLDFNKEEGNTSNGPKYNHLAASNTKSSSFSLLSNGSTQQYTDDSPPIKPKQKFTNIPFSTVINGDQMIIRPELTTEQWSLFEDQVLDFSVSRMYDEHFNEQLSPITWSAVVNRQEIEWFTKNKTKAINDEKNVNESYSFTMDIVNKGGSNQTYTISGLPTWISTASTSGTVSPNSTQQVVFTVDKELSMGTYNADIYLETASAFNDRLSLRLRVLTPAPDWSVNAPSYSNSMNIIGKIKINEVFSRDTYTKVGAFIDGQPRGEALLTYDKAYDSYFAYLTVYSNVTSGKDVSFKLWDAINGKVIVASINGAASTPFLQNEIIGSKSNPAIFDGNQFTEQSTSLNKGWTWVSFFVNDSKFTNIKATFEGLQLANDDMLKSQNTFTRYENGEWYGSLATIESTQMYKMKLANANELKVTGNDVDEANINLQINQGWNWLPFPIHRNISLAEALAFYNPTDGDVIKDQYTFAIYDASSGWSGTLNYMQSNKGYMLKAGKAQTLNYPNSQNAARSNQGQPHKAEDIAQFGNYAYNMSVIAEFVGDDRYTKVKVYDANGILRGVSPLVLVDNKKLSFVTVFSESPEALTFYVANDNEEVAVPKTFVFENNKVWGDLKTPVRLQLDALSSGTEFLSGTVLYPNPFNNTITISLQNASEKLSKIELFSTLGSLITTVIPTQNANTIEIQTDAIANGVYLIKLTSDTGKMLIKKMVKK